MVLGTGSSGPNLASQGRSGGRGAGIISPPSATSHSLSAYAGYCSLTSKKLSKQNILAGISVGPIAFPVRNGQSEGGEKQNTVRPSSSKARSHRPGALQNGNDGNAVLKLEQRIRFKIETRVKLAEISEEYIIGAPVSMHETVDPSLEWDVIEHDTVGFHQLISRLHAADEGVVVSTHWQLQPIVIPTPLVYYYLLIPFQHQSKFLLRALATRDQLIYSACGNTPFYSNSGPNNDTNPGASDSLAQTTTNKGENTAHHLTREKIPAGHYNPLLYSNNITSFYMRA